MSLKKKISNKGSALVAKLCGIYSITNILNNKIYIGSSSDIKKRWGSHKSALNKNKHHSAYLQNSWNKYGAVNFKFTILELTTDVNLLSVEQAYLNQYESYHNIKGYNVKQFVTPTIYKNKQIGLLISESKKKPVYQLDLFGKRINRWNSIGMAAYTLNITPTRISAVCNKNQYALTAGGFKWEFDAAYKYEASASYKSTKKGRGKKVLQYSIDGEFIKEWSNMKAVGNYYDKPVDCIERCVKEKSFTAQGYVWIAAVKQPNEIEDRLDFIKNNRHRIRIKQQLINKNK